MPAECPAVFAVPAEPNSTVTDLVRSRGATVIGLCRGADAAAAAECDHVIELPDCGDEVYPIAAVTALQLFAYYMAVLRGSEAVQELLLCLL